jgi:acetyl esterase/lipase
VPWALLAVGVVVALMTVPAVMTVHHWALLFPAFVFSWLGTGMAGWWLALIPAVTAVLVAFGGLAAWPGWVGLSLVAVSMAALVRQAFQARRGVDEFDRVLAARVTERTRSARPVRAMVLPWSMHDAEVERIKNVRYAEGAGRRHVLDVYRPRRGCEGAPVVLQVHGGGWTVGTKDTQGRPLMNLLARAGWVCVAANYRLSPRSKWPDHLVDVKLALAWIREHIADYGGDPECVVVTGGSAGGHLAAMTALTANDPHYQPEFEHADTRVCAAVPMYGAYDLGEIFGGFESALGRRIAGWVGSLVMGKPPSADPEAYAEASPMTHVRGGAPPFLIVHGTIDNLVPVDQARRFVSRLDAAGVDVTYVELPGAPHAFDVFHSTWEHAATDGIQWWLGSVVRSAPTRAEPARSGGGEPAATDPTTMARTAPS